MRSSFLRFPFAVLLLALAAAVGCDFKAVDPDGTGGGGAGGSGGGGPVCEGKASCAECFTCAKSGPCAEALSACQNDASCVGLDQCMQICAADQECQQGCYQSNPTGAQSYDAMMGCLYCTACPTSCKGYLTCL
jgi:hypothetical protein